MNNYKFYLLFLLFFSFFSYSQENNIHVTYKVKTIKTDSESYNNSNSKIKETLRGVDGNIDRLEYNLYCDSNTSIYFLVKKLEVNEDFTYKLAAILGGSGTYYKNVNEEIRIKNKTSLGEKFNIIYPYEQDKWEITSETKTISGYKCYKATSVRKEHDPIRDREIVFFPEVWFTPEIPFPFGPKGMDGLPGLILEGSINGKTIFYASKIDFKCSECKKNIKKPKGKEILKDDYLKLLAKIREEKITH